MQEDDDLTKRAADMLLQGATLVSDPCPYCRGVRVIKDGNALCVSCGREPERRMERTEPGGPESALGILEKKLESLSKELEAETDHKKQQEIIRSIDCLAEAISKFKKR